jgi:GntR family transcriptional regulator, transcriptional repressor for pyruvate dehydrogenase complex
MTPDRDLSPEAKRARIRRVSSREDGPRALSVTQEAIDKIRELIASGEWGPGARLPREADLAAQLGLSRNSLREAVRALSLVNVLEVRQGDGTYVSSLEASLLLGETTRFATHLLRGKTVLEVFEVRRLLEPAAAALAALRMDEEGRKALKAELDRMFAAGERVEDLVEADAAFHDVIAGSTRNSVLRSLLESLSTRTVRARLWHGAVDRQALDTARAEHTRIFDAIVGGDPDLARSAAMLHIESNERWLREHLDPAAEDVPFSL